MIVLVLAISVYTKCVSIAQTSVCNPWSDSYIDTEQLSLAYNKPIHNPELWESTITNITKHQAQMWKSWLNTDSKVARYYQSVTCFMDIFVTSAQCNEKASKNLAPICDVCIKPNIACLRRSWCICSKLSQG